MVTETGHNESSLERHEIMENRNRNTVIAAITLALLLILNFSFALIQYIRLESRVEVIDEWRKGQMATAVAQQERYIQGLMAIQGLTTTMQALTKQVAALSEQQEAFRRELAGQRIK